jgi:hypothetical protein
MAGAQQTAIGIDRDMLDIGRAPGLPAPCQRISGS